MCQKLYDRSFHVCVCVYLDIEFNVPKPIYFNNNFPIYHNSDLYSMASKNDTYLNIPHKQTNKQINKTTSRRVTFIRSRYDSDLLTYRKKRKKKTNKKRRVRFGSIDKDDEKARML